MGILFIILLVVLVLVSVVSFVISTNLDKKAKRNKEIWFNTHNDKDNSLIDEYIKFVRTNKPIKEKKVKKDEKVK